MPYQTPLWRAPGYFAILCLLAAGEARSQSERLHSREEILSDLHRDAPTLHLRVLKSLADQTLPALERHFAERAPHHPWLFGHLLARYGTDAVLEHVRRTYDRDHLRWGCDSRMPFLAYFLRVNPSGGESLLRAALQERRGNGCFRRMLSNVSRIFSSSRIESVAIDALNDADCEVATDAAGTLSRYGSTDAERHLWRALESWTWRWRHRPADLYGDINKGKLPQEREIYLGQSLRGAIATAQAWYFDESRRQRLYSLCWTDDCPTHFELPAAAAKFVRIAAHQMMFDTPRFGVGWYRADTLALLRAKLSQFPAGTVFAWCTQREGPGELDERTARILLEQVQAIAESQGYSLVHDPPLGTCATDEMPSSFWSRAVAAISGWLF